MKNTTMQKVFDTFKHRKELRQYIREQFTQININNSKLLAEAIYFSMSSADMLIPKNILTKGFIDKNQKRIEKREDGKYYLRHEIKQQVQAGLYDVIVNKIGTTIKEIDKEDTKWKDHDIDENTCAVNDSFNYEYMRQVMCDNGDELNFVYKFNDDKPKEEIENIKTLQVINLNIDSKGECFGYPLIYNYYCNECGNNTTKKTYEVCSTQKKIHCEHEIETVTETGQIKTKRCNRQLYPDKERTETKPFYVYKGSLPRTGKSDERVEIISEKEMPIGRIKAAVILIPREFGSLFLCVVDYKKEKKQKVDLPKKGKRHRIMDLIEVVDNRILDLVNYEIYGYIPMKMAMIIQFYGRYLKDIPNNFNVALVGGKSTGKTTFVDYWGATLYGDNFKSVQVTNISIPKLRGTMESVRLFNQDFPYVCYGWLGDYDLIAIDELKEKPEMKTDLKPLLRNPTYSYAKQGGSGNDRLRTAQMIITENINPNHLKQYRKKVRELYSEGSNTVNEEDERPAWDNGWDLELPLYMYENDYLRNVINTVREEFESVGCNWIDGSELAADDRFVFYFYIYNKDTENEDSELNQVIIRNLERNAGNYNIIDLSRKLHICNFVEEVNNIKVPMTGTNEKEYSKKIIQMLKRNKKCYDARALSDHINMLKILRIIDERDYYIDEDLKILEYIIQNIKNKVNIEDTNKIVVNKMKETQQIESIFDNNSF
jgi:hypothetical protein